MAKVEFHIVTILTHIGNESKAIPVSFHSQIPEIRGSREERRDVSDKAGACESSGLDNPPLQVLLLKLPSMGQFAWQETEMLLTWPGPVWPPSEWFPGMLTIGARPCSLTV